MFPNIPLVGEKRAHVPEEEWAFLESLDFERSGAGRGGIDEQAEFIKMLFTTRLSKYRNLGYLGGAAGALSETNYHNTLTSHSPKQACCSLRAS